MRNGQKRMRGRGGSGGGSGGGGGGGGGNNNNNHRKSQNPLTRVYESNGPDVKIRGTASHIAEKYMQLARDSQSSGDPVAAENYFQHAEHYFRLIAAAQEQFRQQNPYYNQQQPPPQPGVPQGAADDNYDEDDDGSQPFAAQQPDPGFTPQPAQGQPFVPRDTQFPPRAQHQQNQQPQQQPQPDVPGGLPAFITGGGQPVAAENGGQPGPNGHEQGGERQDRFGRRRRRHRGSGGFRPDRPDFNNGNVEGAAPSPVPASDEQHQPE